MSKFTELLTNAREQKHMTKNDVANLMGWTPMYYGRYENGYLIPKGSNITKFASFIGVSCDELEKILEASKKESLSRLEKTIRAAQKK